MWARNCDEIETESGLNATNACRLSNLNFQKSETSLQVIKMDYAPISPAIFDVFPSYLAACFSAAAESALGYPIASWRLCRRDIDRCAKE